MHAGSASSADAKPRRQRFPIIAFLLWGLIAFGVPPVVQTLDAVKVVGFPLGFVMLAQGCLVAFVAVAVLSALRRNALEKEE